MKDMPMWIAIVVIGLVMVAVNSAIPPQPEPTPGSFWDKVDDPLPLPVGIGLIAVVLAMGAFLHSPKGLKSGCSSWILIGGVFILIIWATYQF